jgi:hypothetical protein
MTTSSPRLWVTGSEASGSVFKGFSLDSEVIELRTIGGVRWLAGSSRWAMVDGVPP